jgi:hypothetical protein
MRTVPGPEIFNQPRDRARVGAGTEGAGTEGAGTEGAELSVRNW